MNEKEAFELLEGWMQIVDFNNKFLPHTNDELIDKIATAVNICLERIKNLEVENGKLKTGLIKN